MKPSTIIAAAGLLLFVVGMYSPMTDGYEATLHGWISAHVVPAIGVALLLVGRWLNRRERTKRMAAEFEEMQAKRGGQK